MPTEVEIPNIGVVEFPDEMSVEDINAAIKGSILPEYVERKKSEVAQYQAEAERILAERPVQRTWSEQVSEEPSQQQRVPVTTIAPSVAMPWPSLEQAPTIPASPAAPLMPFKKFDIAPGESIPSAALKSIGNLAISLPEFATSPIGMAAGPAAATVPTVVSGLFTIDLAKSLMQQAPDLIKNWDDMTAAQRTEGIINAVGTAGLAAMLGIKTNNAIQRKIQARNIAKKIANLNRNQIPLPPASSLLGQPAPAPPPPRLPGAPISPVFAGPPGPTGPTPTTPVIPKITPRPPIPTGVVGEAARQGLVRSAVEAVKAAEPAQPETGKTPAGPQPVGPVTVEQVGVSAGAAPTKPALPATTETATTPTEVSQARRLSPGLTRAEAEGGLMEITKPEGETAIDRRIREERERKAQDAIQERATTAVDVGTPPETGAEVKPQVRQQGAEAQAKTEVGQDYKSLANSIIKDIEAALQEAGISLNRFKVFGSRRRGDFKDASDIDIAITVPAELRDAADTIVGRMDWQDAIKAKYGAFPDIHVKGSKTKGGIPRAEEEAKGMQVGTETEAASAQAAQPAPAKTDIMGWVYRPIKGSRDASIQGDRGTLTARAHVVENEDGTFSVNEMTVFVPPEILDPRIAPRETVELVTPITGKTAKEVSESAYKSFAEQLNKGVFKPTKPQIKQLWEMTGEEFAAAAGRGKVHKATGKPTPGKPTQADTSLSIGEREGYSQDDIAHFYVARRGGYRKGAHDSDWFNAVEEGRRELIEDAITEGKPVPAEVLAEYPDLAKKAQPPPQAQPAQTPPPTPEPEVQKAEKVDTVQSAGEKMSDEFKDVARTEGKKSANEVKDELIFRLEKEIASAPSKKDARSLREIETVTIEIPGDGVFKVAKVREQLQELLKRAMRLETKPTEPKVKTTKAAIKASQATMDVQALNTSISDPVYKSLSREQIDELKLAKLKAGAAQPPPASTTLPGKPPPPTATPPPPGPKPFTPGALKTPKSKKLGIVAGQPLPQLDPLWTRVKNMAKRLFTGQGLSPDAMFEAERIMGHARTMYNRQIERLNVDLRRAIRRVYGISALKEAGGGFRRLPDQDVQMMDDYLKGNVYNAAQIPPEIRGVLDNMRAVIDGLSTDLADQLRAKAAALPQNQRGKANALRSLADRILQNRDHYMHRSYAFFDSKLNATEWFNQMPTAVRQVAENYIQRTQMTNIPLIEAQRKLVNWLEDLKPTLGKGKGIPGTSKLGSMDLTTLMSRKAIPEELRALLGEYRDPLTNFTKTVSKLAQQVTAQEFLNTVRDAGLRDGWLFEAKNAPPGWQVEIAGKGSDPMHPLNGMRTSPEIAEIFTEYSRLAEKPNWLMRYYYKANALSKGAATTQSLMTQMRNLMGQPFFWGMAGHWNADAMRQAFVAMREEVTRGGNQAARAYLDDAARYGVLGTTARFRELTDVLKDAEFTRATPEQLQDFSVLDLIAKWGYREPARFYRMSDEFGKLVGWEAEKANVRAVNPDWTPEQVKAEAGKRISKFYADYDMVSPFVRSFRKLPFGPFVTFPVEMIRTSVNAIGQSVKELRSSNPVERSIGAKRLASQLVTLSAPYVVAEATGLIYGVSGEEEKDFRQFQPDYAKNSTYAWMPSKAGERNTINLSYLNPFNYMDVINAAILGVKSGESWEQTAFRVGKEFLEPFMSEQMFATAIFDWLRNAKKTGGRVYNPEDEGQNIVLNIARHLTMPMFPGTAQRAVKRTIPAFYKDQPEYGRKLVPTREIAREMTGVSLDGFDYKSGLAYGAKDYAGRMRDAMNLFTEPIYKKQPASDAEMVASYIKSDKKRQEIWSELRLKYLAALRRGVPIGEALRAMVDNGLGKNTAESIAAGIYVPYNVSKDVYENAMRKGKKIPLRAIMEYNVKTHYKPIGTGATVR